MLRDDSFECVIRMWQQVLYVVVWVLKGIDWRRLFRMFWNDEPGDPIINDSHQNVFLGDWRTAKCHEVLNVRVNNVLKPLFLAGGMLLVDYKLEFGLFNGEIVLGDEFSPDGCRLWILKYVRSWIKIVFVKVGGVVESYELVAQRLELCCNLGSLKAAFVLK